MLRRLIPGALIAYLSTLRFPALFATTAAIFIADLLLPDLIPFADEILLGLGTALLGRWKRKSLASDRVADALRKDTPPTPPKR